MKKVIFTIIFLISLLLISASPNTIRAENSDKKLDLFEFKVTEDFSLGDMNVEEIIQVIYLNDQLSVDYRIFGLPFSPYGHVAVILVKADGSGVYYSFNPTETSIQTIIPKLNNVDGTIDRVELTSINMANFLPGGSGALPSGREYTRFISISVDKDIGNIMLKTAESKCSVAPNLYNLYENNCNTFVQQILNAGKLNFDPVNMIPNYAYNTGVLQWSTYNDYKAGSYDLSTIESIKVSVSNFETNLLNGLLKLSEFSIQTQTGEISTTKSQTSTETSKVATETTVSIPPPGKPSLTSPYNWYQSLGGPPMLMWSGDNNSTSYYVVVNSSNTGNVESGWINSTSWKPNLPNQNYIYTWKVKAKNSQGVEGPWSDDSHFSIASTTLKFEGGISFSTPSPSSADMIKIFASTTGWGGVGITLRVSVNTAPDGSANGEWKILKELGVPKFNESDAPEWHTNSWSNGTYRIRVEAKGPNDPFWLNSAIIESTYTLIGKADVQEVRTTEDTNQNNLALNGDFSLGNFNYWDPPVGDISIYNSGGNFVAKCINTNQQSTDIYHHICEISTNDLNFSCRVKPASFQSGHIQIYVCLFSSDNVMVGDFSPIYYPGELPVGSWTKISKNLSSYPDFDWIIFGVITNGDNIVYLDDFKIY